MSGPVLQKIFVVAILAVAAFVTIRNLKAATMIGVASADPAWSPREQRVIALEDRRLNCIMRRCNELRTPAGKQSLGEQKRGQVQ